MKDFDYTIFIYLAIIVASLISLHKVKFFSYMKSVLSKDTHDSSKRLIAISLTALVAYSVLRYTDSTNFKFVIAEILTAVGLLFGIAGYKSVQSKRYDSQKPPKPSKKEKND